MAANNRIGSKRLVVGAHYGLRDWLAQRITACVMAPLHGDPARVVLRRARLLLRGLGVDLRDAMDEARHLRQPCFRSSITRGSASATSGWTM